VIKSEKVYKELRALLAREFYQTTLVLLLLSISFSFTLFTSDLVYKVSGLVFSIIFLAFALFERSNDKKQNKLLKESSDVREIDFNRMQNLEKIQRTRELNSESRH
jgi:uncharacterized membrane protein YobD (UPF0266 family)